MFIREVVPQPPEPRWLAQEILRRDRQRVRLLSWLCILFWLAGLAGLVLLVVALDQFVISIRVSDYLTNLEKGKEPDSGLTRSAAQMERLRGTSLLHHSIPVIGGSIGALLLAALCTLLLVSSSRSATLHQISISLMELSEQFKQLRQASGAEAGPRAEGG
jgi:hypothetical protein